MFQTGSKLYRQEELECLTRGIHKIFKLKLKNPDAKLHIKRAILIIQLTKIKKNWPGMADFKNI